MLFNVPRETKRILSKCGVVSRETTQTADKPRKRRDFCLLRQHGLQNRLHIPNMRPHLQPAFPCLAGFFSVWQSVDFVNILMAPDEDTEPLPFNACAARTALIE